MARNIALLVGASLIAIVASPALAETAPATEATASGAQADSGEILVTARKREETIVDVPTAVTALTAAQLSTRGIVDYSGLNQFVPGFRWNPSGSSNSARTFNTFVIRGTYSGSDHPDRQNVSVFIDGIPIGGAGSIPGLTDIRQVEVVKGPQSAYFGRSTFGGAVNFITTTPGNELRVTGSADIATRGNEEISLGVEGPIVKDLLSVRVSGRYYHAGGQYENFGFGGDALGERETKSLAATVNFTPASNFRMRGYFTAWRDHDGPYATALLTAADYNCNAGAGVAGALNYVCGKISSTPANHISQNTSVDPARIAQLAAGNATLGQDFISDFGFRRKAYFGDASAQYDLPNDWTLTANGGLGRNRYAVLADNANRYPQTAYSVTLTPWEIVNRSAEVRLATDQSKPLKALIGANYFRQISHTGSNSVRNTSTALIAGLPYQRGKANTYGVFGSLAYDITDKINVSAEGRYQWDKIRSTVLLPGGVDAAATSKSFTPRVIAQYKFSRNANVYVSYSEGRRPSQFNTNVFSLTAAAKAELAAQADIPLAVPEERLRMEEFGFKGDFMNHRLRILSAVYYGQWRDRQIQQTLQYHATPTTLTQLLVYLPNGKVNIYGVEMEGHFDATRTVSVDGTFAYSETNIRNTYCTDCRSITGNPTPVGTRLPRYPAYTATGSIDYHPDLGHGWTGIARFDWIYTGKQYDSEANVAYVAASNVFNLRLGGRLKGTTFEVFARNLFNDDTPLNIGRTPDTFNSSNTLILAPAQKRVIGVHVGFDL